MGTRTRYRGMPRIGRDRMVTNQADRLGPTEAVLTSPNQLQPPPSYRAAATKVTR